MREKNKKSLKGNLGKKHGLVDVDRGGGKVGRERGEGECGVLRKRFQVVK